MSPDSMRVRLHLYRIRVVEVLVDLPERLEVVIRDLRSVVRCPFCGLKTTKVHETRRVKVTDVPRGPQRVTLIWLRRRFECTSCGERHTEAHPAIEGKMTTRLARAIITDARHLSITEIGRRYGFAWHTVMTSCVSGPIVSRRTVARSGAGSCSSTRPRCAGDTDT